MNKKKKIGIAAVAVVVLAIVIVLVVHFTGDRLEAMEKKDLIVQSNLEMTEVNVISQMSGQIVELNVAEGDAVETGQVLAKVESDTLLAQKSQAEAGIKAIQGQIKSAQAAYEKAQNGSRPEEEAQAKANYDLAKSTYERMKNLYANGAISKADFDATETQYNVAKQSYEMAQNGARPEDIKAAAAAVETLQGQLESAQGSLQEINTYLEKTVIKAPISGVITQLDIDQGGMVASGTPVAVVTDAADSWIQCNVMENELGNIKVGAPVTIEFGTYPGESFQGEIIAVNKSADFAMKRATNANGEFDILSYGVKVKPYEVDQELFAGMTAFVNLGPLPNTDANQ